MRDLIISVILFSLLIAAIVGNSLFVTEKTEEIRAAVDRIPSIGSPDCKLRIDELRLLWQDFKKVARLSLSYTELNRIECLIAELDCHRQTGNANDFEHAKVLLTNLLVEMERLEKVTLDGVM